MQLIYNIYVWLGRSIDNVELQKPNIVPTQIMDVTSLTSSFIKIQFYKF